MVDVIVKYFKKIVWVCFGWYDVLDISMSKILISLGD